MASDATHIRRVYNRGLQRTQSGGLLRRHIQSNAGGAHHALAPAGDLLGTLDIALDGCGKPCVKIIGNRPLSSSHPYFAHQITRQAIQ
jgi:hypothetical protein